MSWLGHGPTRVLNREIFVSRANAALAHTAGSSGSRAVEISAGLRFRGAATRVGVPALLVVSVTPSSQSRVAVVSQVGGQHAPLPGVASEQKAALGAPVPGRGRGGGTDQEAILLLEF